MTERVREIDLPVIEDQKTKENLIHELSEYFKNRRENDYTYTSDEYHQMHINAEMHSFYSDLEDRKSFNEHKFQEIIKKSHLDIAYHKAIKHLLTTYIKLSDQSKSNQSTISVKIPLTLYEWMLGLLSGEIKPPKPRKLRNCDEADEIFHEIQMAHCYFDRLGKTDGNHSDDNVFSIVETAARIAGVKGITYDKVKDIYYKDRYETPSIQRSKENKKLDKIELEARKKMQTELDQTYLNSDNIID